ncbi:MULTISPECIES: hypothetical protein [unclassified Sphingomonas]|uniref:hypothetical protein n=1 Tax=unclassified Sphingomonas TaxID=196159 RepID=UPI001D118B26|nr:MULTISPECIES: hypothetical protein [unclassified Sphingomonas]MCC2980675.1 hypothetical protein [Sphingomonas sp. IC4-52]MCD2316786.1 hypothetical protein [Sphingomonas sp. IC-11]
MYYVALKNFVASMVEGGADTLAHVHGGMLVLMLARLITRRSLATPVPLACVVVLQVLNECIDRYNHGSWRWPDTIGDTLNTLFWPTVLFVGLRLRRQRDPAPSVATGKVAEEA